MPTILFLYVSVVCDTVETDSVQMVFVAQRFTFVSIVIVLECVYHQNTVLTIIYCYIHNKLYMPWKLEL